MLYTGMGWVRGRVVRQCHSTYSASMNNPVAPLLSKAKTWCICCVSVVSTSTSKCKELGDGTAATTYQQGRQRSQAERQRQDVEGGEGTPAESLAGEVSCTTKRVLLVSGSVIELSAGVDVLADSTDKQANRLAPSSGGVQLIHRLTKNPL